MQLVRHKQTMPKSVGSSPTSWTILLKTKSKNMDIDQLLKSKSPKEKMDFLNSMRCKVTTKLKNYWWI